MKKAILVVVIASMLLVSLVLEMQQFVKANPEVYPKRFPLNIYFNSPLNKTYNSNLLVLNVTLEEASDCENTIRKASYSLDGAENVSLPLVFNGMSSHNGNALLHSETSGIINLPALSEGEHTITVFGEFDINNEVLKNTCTSTFNILTTPNPSVPEFSWLTILPILLTTPIALTIVRKRLQRNV
jgi:hypothetical protein